MIGSTVKPNTYDITHLRGDDQEYDFYVTDFTGAVLDITSWSFFFTVKFSLDDDILAAKFQKALTSGITVISAVDGHGRIAISSADTSALAGNYIYDLVGVDTAGKTHTLRRVSFIVPKDVTTPGTAGQATSALVSFPNGVLVTAFYFQDTVTLQYYKQVFENGVWNTYGPSATYPF
jgi:hypothetical protein